MSQVKQKLKLIIRNLKSLVAVCAIYIFNLRTQKMQKTLFNLRYKYIHIICPGPTAVEFYNYKTEENSAIIFVNHAVKMSPKLNQVVDKFFFSADATRVKEVIELSPNELRSCTSVLFPGHLFQVDSFQFFKKINIMLLPRISFDFKYGIVARDNGPENFTHLEKRPNSYGFGSLNSSLQLATLFEPLEITFWGCDFGDIKGIRYFDKNVPQRATEQFDLTKEHFKIIKESINNSGIKLKNGFEGGL